MSVRWHRICAIAGEVKCKECVRLTRLLMEEAICVLNAEIKMANSIDAASDCIFAEWETGWCGISGFFAEATSDNHPVQWDRIVSGPAIDSPFEADDNALLRASRRLGKWVRWDTGLTGYALAIDLAAESQLEALEVIIYNS